MNLKSMEKDEKNLVTLTIGLESVEFEQAIEKAYKRDAGRFNVPGFRRGKAPRRMIETIYGPSAFYESAVNLSYPGAYEQALRDNDLEPVENADIEVTDIGAEGYSFVARVHVYPEAEVGAYKGLHAYRPPVEVDVGDIDAELSRLQSRNARLVTVSRPIQNNDAITLDFEGFLDDIPFEGGKGENFQLTIGSGQFIPGFEEQLVGRSAGEDCQVTVTFPEDYHAAELAGREAVFFVTIHEVKESEKPELDDEFAKDVSQFDTLEELRADIRAKLEAQRAKHSDEIFENALAEQVYTATEAEVPDVMIREQQSELLQDMARRLSEQGMELSSWLEATGQTVEGLKDEMRAHALRQITVRLAFEKIAALEELEVPEEELEAEYAKMAGQLKTSSKRVKEAVPEKSLRRDLLRMKASAFVKENAFADVQPPEQVVIREQSPSGTDAQSAELEE